MNEDVRPLILHVIHRLFMGGMENGLINLVNRLPESRFRHAIACIEDYSDFQLRLRRRDVDVYAFHRSRVGLWNVRYGIFRLCRRLRPAVVHTRNLSGLDALLPAHLAGVPQCIHGEHGWEVSDLHGTSRKLALLRRMHSPLVDRYVTVSRDLERYLTSRVGIAPSRISHIYNGVDTERFAPEAKKPAGVLPEGFVDAGCVVIGTVGRVEPVKDHATLVRAFGELVRGHPDLAPRVRLAIVGSGSLLEELRALVKELGLEAFAWVPGAVEDVPTVLRTFDVFVLPSLAEGVSNTILEAMATGVPILATAVGGNVEVVGDEKVGRLFPPGDVGALTRLLVGCVNNPQPWESLGREARRVAIDRFSLSTMVGEYQAIYNALCYGNRECPA